ncbi:hypothetical protein [Niabella beijingensis]|uniref:hypothetical protein n=1 Tax=Niabella beijingensis TaxID=2872700 RepID=UPI001CBD2EED|nr:hypothetical protein [Niabella beijingensis]MBZ4190500.1 hypothetical protein [Niabella beijingensis]
MINYHNKKFRPVRISENSETSPDTIFHYTQEGAIVTASYSGGSVVKGHLMGLVNEEGVIQLCYHQVNEKGQLMTGRCRSTPEQLPGGKIRLHEVWQWTSGDQSEGTSVIEEF